MQRAGMLVAFAALFALLVAAPARAGTPSADWARLDRQYTQLAWGGLGMGVAGAVMLPLAYTRLAWQKDDALLPFAYSALVMGPPLLTLGALHAAFALRRFAESGPNPLLGYLSAGLLGWAGVFGALKLTGEAIYRYGDADYPPYSQYGEWAYVLACASMLTGTGQIAVNAVTRIRFARRGALDGASRRGAPHVAILPRIDRAPGVVLVGAF